MAKTWYVLGTAAVTPNWWGTMQDGGSPPTGANSAYGWTPKKTALTTAFYKPFLGATAASAVAQAASYVDAATGPVHGSGSGATTAGDSFITPTAITQSFQAATWTFNWNLRAGVAGCVGQIRMRVWASVNASGASARELTSGALAGAIVTLSTTADTNSSIAWSAPIITLNNEFLFFQVEWKETTLGSSTTDSVLFRVGTADVLSSATLYLLPGAVGTYTITGAAARLQVGHGSRAEPITG